MPIVCFILLLPSKWASFRKNTLNGILNHISTLQALLECTYFVIPASFQGYCQYGPFNRPNRSIISCTRPYSRICIWRNFSIAYCLNFHEDIWYSPPKPVQRWESLLDAEQNAFQQHKKILDIVREMMLGSSLCTPEIMNMSTFRQRIRGNSRSLCKWNASSKRRLTILCSKGQCKLITRS